MSLDLNEAIKNARLQHEAGNLTRAEELYSQVLTADARHPMALHGIGTIAHNRGELETAVEMLTRALEHGPMVPALHNSLGVALNASGRTEQALKSFARAVDLAPDYHDAVYNMANALTSLDRHREAVDCYRRVLAKRPQDAFTHFNLGIVLQHCDQHEEALRCFERVIELGHDPANVLKPMAASLQMLKRYSDAADALQNSLKIHDCAETRADLGMILLQMGRFKKGWRQYAWRIDASKTWKLAYTSALRWDGSAFPGRRLLLLCEQGLGDNIQFIRYLPMVRRMGGTVVLAVHPQLRTLFEQLADAEQVVEVSETSSPCADFDIVAPLIDLPGHFNTTLKTIPANVPYLHPQPSKKAAWKQRLSVPQLKVGIVWGGSTAHLRNDHRSCGIQWFLPLSCVPNVRLYSLQKGPAAAQLQQLPPETEITDLAPLINDFSDTAAAVANLDLIITVDTSVLHLAGAMARPAWAALCFEGDWRWLIDRADSPWYPTVRLFRQTTLGDWKDVFSRIEKRLRTLARDYIEIPTKPLKSQPACRDSSPGPARSTQAALI